MLNSSLKLLPQQLKHCGNIHHLPKDTRFAQSLNIEFGQKRACAAIRTGLEIPANGYHIFATGENGLGKRTLITKLLSDYVKQRPKPKDWIYVNNFDDVRSPKAIALPTGMANLFAKDMQDLWLNVKKQLNKRFYSEHYQAKIEAIKNQVAIKEQQAYADLHEESKQYQLVLSVRPSNNQPTFIHQPTNEHQLTLDNKQHSDKSMDNCSLYQNKNHMLKRFSLLTTNLEKIEDETNQTLQSLHHSLAKRTLTPIFSPLLNKYQAIPDIIIYLNQVFSDMVKQVESIIQQDDEFSPSHFSVLPARYFVNVMVSHAPNADAPIVFEDLPTHLNLLGHVEQITQMGTVFTDVSLIRAGSLHRANGGYLILQASSLLEYPYAWQGLKRALQSKQIKISSLEQMLTLTGNISLEPQAIELDVKVILLGEPNLYYDLLDFEPEFNAVFKIRADFHDKVQRTIENELAMVGKIADMVDKYQLLPFNNTALARILDYLSEQAEDQNELSLHTDRLLQILLESNRQAIISNQQMVNNHHVEIAIAEMLYRLGYLRDLYWQELQKGQQLISTKGQAIGQINALTVIGYADSEFGLPARLTATVHHSQGNADILDIERDVDLGGSIHAKGILIMSGYLRSIFAQQNILNFTASLAFEQSYADIDGDSATIAETCALLSALANVPINQALAVTGSMNQFGQVQAVGGINAKIAGFFDACLEQGLTGHQGVIIPKANLQQLMLRQDIINQVTQEKFHIYAIEHVNQAMYLLTGVNVNDMTKKGKYRKHSIYGKIYQRLANWQTDESSN